MGNTLKIQIQEKDVRKKVPALGDHYTASITYEVHTFKNKNKRKLLRDIFVYHFLLYICLFVAAKLL